MKFEISSVLRYTVDDVLKEYPCLKNYCVHRYDNTLVVKLDSLEELITLQKELDHSLIIQNGNHIMEIQIYDSYIE